MFLTLLLPPVQPDLPTFVSYQVTTTVATQAASGPPEGSIAELMFDKSQLVDEHPRESMAEQRLGLLAERHVELLHRALAADDLAIKARLDLVVRELDSILASHDSEMLSRLEAMADLAKDIDQDIKELNAFLGD